MEGAGPGVLLHEPAAHLRGDVPEAATEGGDVRRGKERARSGQPRAESLGGGYGVRVHGVHQEGQVQAPRRERRHRQALLEVVESGGAAAPPGGAVNRGLSGFPSVSLPF